MSEGGRGEAEEQHHDIPQCVTVREVTLSIQITHWNWPSLTRLSILGAMSSLGTSSTFDRSMLSGPSMSGFSGASKSTKRSSPSQYEVQSLRVFVGRLVDCEFRRLLATAKELLAEPAFLFLLEGVGGRVRSMKEAIELLLPLSSSGSSLVRSTKAVLLLLPMFGRHSALMASPISSGFGRLDWRRRGGR